MDARTHFLQLARYNVWATQRLLDAVAAVSDADYRQDVGLFFGSIHGTLNHLLVGEHMLWYPRFASGTSPTVALNAEVEPDRGRLAQALRGGAANWLPLIASWPGERFDGALGYTNMRGQAVRLPFAATLAHVFNHGTHHRGQVTAALTALGHTSPELDLVYLLQEESKA
ncbi:MAG: DinB family protein [Hydrogenophaga sp.]|uniref:DinB family protein n=1 Tax=Hydrogenophaga sp. TaxID=1904254 RepID=UPI00261D5B35|nr:DinB family protein [Hydrogenophaga sp.]MDD3784052.1 DinB family protein [Hydrogenophaga sp.]